MRSILRVGSIGVRNFSSAPNPSKFGVGRLNHVAIAVPDLKASANYYRDVLGAKVSDPLDLPEHGVTTIFVELNNTKIELLHPLGEKSPISNFLEKNQAGGIHHICLEVDDIKKAIAQVKANGIKVLNEEPKIDLYILSHDDGLITWTLFSRIAIGAHGKPVVFLHPKSCNGVLTELEQV